MQPLSARTRRTYFFVLAFIFVAAILPLGLYATGWRFTTAEGLVRTGGVYLHVSSPGVTAYVDGQPAETSSLLQRNIFVQNLAPAEYEFSVSKEGYRSWKKTLSIRSQKVTEAHPLLVPETPERIDIPEFLPTASSTATGTKSVATKNPEYATITALFEPVPVSKKIASTTPATNPLEKTKSKLRLTPEGNTITASWHGSVENAPFYFCTTGTCTGTTTVTFADRIMYADFYPGEQDFIIIQLPGGVYVAELDARSSVGVVPLLEKKGAEFRIDTSGKIFLKEGKAFSELVL